MKRRTAATVSAAVSAALLLLGHERVAEQRIKPVHRLTARPSRAADCPAQFVAYFQRELEDKDETISKRNEDLAKKELDSKSEIAHTTKVIEL